MKPDLPPMTWLRAFEAAARNLSFTLAAAELNVTQAAISKHVKSLELYLREPLFHRKPRALVLTKAGAAYLPKLRDVFERLAEGTEEIFGRRRSDCLTVRANAAFAVNWIAPRLPRFLDAHPKLRLRLVSSIWSDELEKERFDLDIRYGNGKRPGFRADRLSWERLEPLCAPETAKMLNKPDDLAQHRLLHVLGYEDGWAVWLKAAGALAVSPSQGVQFDSSLMAFQVAAQGGGVALGRSSMSHTEIAARRLVRPFDVSVPIDEAFYLFSANDGTEHPDTTVFRNWLLDEVQNLRSDPSIDQRTGLVPL